MPGITPTDTEVFQASYNVFKGSLSSMINALRNMQTSATGGGLGTNINVFTSAAITQIGRVSEILKKI